MADKNRSGNHRGTVSRRDRGDRARIVAAVVAKSKVAQPLSWPAVLGLLALVVLACALCAVGVDDACHHTPPPVDVPSPGTDRAAYCDALASVHPWLALVAGPAVLAALALVALRRSPRWAMSAALALVVLAVVNASVAHSLGYVHTI